MLDGARAQAFEMCSSTVLLAELFEVLSRDKFAARLALAGLTPFCIVREIRRMVCMVVPDSVPRVIEDDPDDDHVIACAVVAEADFIVSGDKHLHSLGGQYQGIRIVSPAEALAFIKTE